jgi:predicted 3-demethylubiquinone-9 3-methyltransferase (glyoxalase superfamily)
MTVHHRAKETDMHKISTCLWFDTQAEEAANFYVSLFEDSKVTDVQHLEGTPSGDDVALVFFRLAGKEFSAINGGPQFPFTEAVSISVGVEDQAEVDRLWAALTADGGEEGQCGWLKDKFGLSWQVIPERMGELLSDPDPGRRQRAMQAMLQMQKIDLKVMEDAANAA